MGLHSLLLLSAGALCLHSTVLAQTTLSPTSTCGGPITVGGGYIKSPNYPNNYLDGLNCEWTLTAPPGKTIFLQIQNFSIELCTNNCCYDSLEIYDAPNKLLARYCGSVLSGTGVFSTSNQMVVRFSTDGSVTMSGFYLTYKLVQECGGLLSATQTWKTFTSPNYPIAYRNYLDCQWSIVAPSQHVVQFQIQNMDIEQCGTGSACTCDYLQLYDGATVGSPSLGKYCGNSLPSPSTVSSTNSAILARFFTDSSVTKTGFSAQYRALCETTTAITSVGGFITSPNFPSNYDNNESCRWTLTSPTGTNITLTFQTFNLEYCTTCCYDRLEVRDGNTAGSPLLGNYCGSTLPPTVTSTGNSMTLVFNTDSSVTYTGFLASYSY